MADGNLTAAFTATPTQFADVDMEETDLSQIVNVTREYPFDYAIVMFGYIMPFVLVLTLVTNTLVVLVLTQRHMRTPTNIVLVSMALVDTFTLLLPSPWYLYIYTLGNYDKFLHPYGWCYTHYLMTDVFPVFFHTSSIWLALLLASQRYIYVCHPTLARTWCTVPRVKKAIFLILLIALLHQASRFFDTNFTLVSINYKGRKHEACREDYADWVQRMDIALYYTTYFTFRIFFVFILPCGALITLNYLLFRALKRAENKRTELLKTKFKLVGGVSRTKEPLAKRAATALLPVANHQASELSLATNNNYSATIVPAETQPTVAPPGGALLNGRLSAPPPPPASQKVPLGVGPCHAQRRDLEAGRDESCSDDDDDDDDSICAECAACRRCSAELAVELAPANSASALRNSQHLPISQCSSILGHTQTTTNTTNTNTNTNFLDEDNLSSSCHAHQERDSSAESERRRSSGATLAIGSVGGDRLVCGCLGGQARKLKLLGKVERIEELPSGRTRRATSDSSLRLAAPTLQATGMHQSASTNSGALLQVQAQQQQQQNGATVQMMTRSLASSPASKQKQQQQQHTMCARTNSANITAAPPMVHAPPPPPLAAVHHQSVRTMDSNRTTLMLVVVVSVFLVVEVPVAIVTILHVVGNLFDLFHDDQIMATLNYIKLFTNFFIMISYSVNFTIYCSMSKKFRETFRDLFFCGPADRKHQKRMLYQTQAQPSQYVTHTNNAQALVQHHQQQQQQSGGAGAGAVHQVAQSGNRSREFCLHAGNLSARARRNSFALQNDTLATATTTLTWRTNPTSAAATPPTRAPATRRPPSGSSSASATPTNSSAHSSSSSASGSSSLSSGSSGSSSPRACSSPPPPPPLGIGIGIGGKSPPAPPTQCQRKSASGKLNGEKRRLECQL